MGEKESRTFRPFTLSPHPPRTYASTAILDRPTLLLYCTCVSPSSTFHKRMLPRDAAALIMPWSLFLYSHALPSVVMS